MGWSSGTSLMEVIIETIQENVGDPDKRRYMYADIIPAFIDADWDNVDEVMGIDPEFDDEAKRILTPMGFDFD